MRTRQAFTWAGIYLGAWLLVTAIAAGVVVAGVALDGLRVVGLSAYTPLRFQGGTVYPRTGLALIALGGLLWQFGTTAALFRTIVTAIEDETARTFDAEAMKSDILSVLDDRLSEMHQDVSQTRQIVNRMGREDAAEEFEFEGFEDFE